ncbi:hypothetical protein AGMMS49940_10770 [Spirochaetia bacterium]|nr:hypothetical protein AGMMS49940_10770 [Spirochaetia bacterium]
MKKRFVFVGTMAALALGLVLIGCDNGSTSGGGNGGGGGGGGNITTDLTYSATTEDVVFVIRDTPRVALSSSSYRASISDAGGGERAALTAGSYYYEIYHFANLVSHGAIQIVFEGTKITFTCTVNGSSFTGNITDDKLSFVDPIVLDDGDSWTFADDLSIQNQGGPNPFIGTWNDEWGYPNVITSSTWKYSYMGIAELTYTGTYTYIGNTATYFFDGSIYPYVTTIINGVFHAQGIAYTKSGDPTSPSPGGGGKLVITGLTDLEGLYVRGLCMDISSTPQKIYFAVKDYKLTGEWTGVKVVDGKVTLNVKVASGYTGLVPYTGSDELTFNGFAHVAETVGPALPGEDGSFLVTASFINGEATAVATDVYKY